MRIKNELVTVEMLNKQIGPMKDNITRLHIGMQKEFHTPYRKNSEMFGACFLSSGISILICQLINYLKG